MGTAYWVSRLVYTAANLRLADHLANGPRSAAELAGATGTNPRALHRFMRTLASFGILTQDDGDSFALTPLGDALKSDAPGAARVDGSGDGGAVDVERLWRVSGTRSRPARPAMEKVFGMPLFDYLAQHPQEAAQFSEAMVGIHGAEPPAVAAAYDFSRVRHDRRRRRRHRQHAGPHPGSIPAAAEASCSIARTSSPKRRRCCARTGWKAGSRSSTETSSSSVPAGGDVYILSHIIHDWNEEQCLTILGNCRKAMKPGAKLLIVEFVLPEGNTPHFGKLVDMVMLAIPGGEERTRGRIRNIAGGGRTENDARVPDGLGREHRRGGAGVVCAQ